MKRFTTVIFLLLVFLVTAFSQQRLAILPMTESIALNLTSQSVNLPSICIDGGLGSPGVQMYNRVLEKGTEEILINGQRYDEGLQGLVDEKIVDITTQEYSHVKISIVKNATYRGQPVTSLSYRQLTSTNIGNQSHNAEDIMTDIIFKNFDLKGKSSHALQNEFWRIEKVLKELKKKKLLVFDAQNKLSSESLQLIKNIGEITERFSLSSFETGASLAEKITQRYDLPNHSLAENVEFVLRIGNEVEKTAVDFLEGRGFTANQYVKVIAKDRYNDGVGLIVELNGKREYWEMQKGAYGNKNRFYQMIQIPDVSPGQIERIGRRYYFNGNLIMNEIDVSDALLQDIKTRVGTGQEVKITFSKNVTGYDNVKATLQSMQIQHQFEISRYAFNDLLGSERFSIARATISDVQGGFTITIPKAAVQSRGSLVIKIRNVITSKYNVVKTKIRSLIRKYTAEPNVNDFLDELEEELAYIQYTTDIDIIVELSDRRTTKVINLNGQNANTFIAFGGYKTEEYFYGNYLSFTRSSFH